MTRTLRELADIPNLALEVAMTRYAPNPTDRPARTNRTPQSRPPLSIAMLHALMPGRDAEPGQQAGLRSTLTTDVRIVIDELADLEQTYALPPWPSDTWTSICDWLTRTYPWWTTTTCADTIATDIHQVWAELRQLTHADQGPHLVCQRCGAPLTPGPTRRFLLCPAGHKTRTDIETQWRHRAMTPATTIADELGIKPERIRLWKHRGRLRRYEHHDGQLWVHPWDVLLLARPDIAAAIKDHNTPPAATGAP